MERCSDDVLPSLIQAEGYVNWKALIEAIQQHYEIEMDQQWRKIKLKWEYEYKFSRNKKTLCALYAKQDVYGFMLIFGQKERTIFEERRTQFLPSIQNVYDQTTTYHDGKWMMFTNFTQDDIPQFLQLLNIKRKWKK